MKLQLALDMLSTSKALEMVEKTVNFIDIVEVGTPLLKHEGIAVVEAIKREFPQKELLVDLKSMDVGEYEADFAFGAGADYVTVLGVADEGTINGAINSAKRFNKSCVIDLMNVSDKLSLAKEFAQDGVFVAVHTGIDQQAKGLTPLKDLKELSTLNSPIFVAGGINLDSIDGVIEHKPYSIVVGGAICNSTNPAETAQRIKEKISKGSL
jgi:3-hexulose-6-phosphate synthase